MEVIADLHLHSRYSRAVSQQMVLPQMAKWGIKKGIDLLGTGDWTHPLWLRELKENLEEAGDGIFILKKSVRDAFFAQKGYLTPSFILSTEISLIYSQGGQGHRIHNLIFAPNFEVVEEINNKLRSHGVNLLSDGRPMTGLSSQQICEIVFSVDRNCLVIPAHAWTPWYSLYGSNSGFDSLGECFGEFTEQITAIETGLSSSPAMNWRIEELDKRSIVSFSDAHSPQKLGREATVFEIEDIKKLRYEDIRKAIINNKITYTIEFYPEEGKYHYTGHRNCGVKQSPEETKKLGETCPVCGRKLTVGVMHRVEELASRPVDFKPESRPPYKMLVPLMEILAEVLGSGFSSQTVENEYNRLTEYFGSEFGILLKTPLKEMAKIGGERLAEAMDKVRKGDIFIDPGYDGVFGTVKIWPLADARGEPSKEQMKLF
jgi:uncharacterized protein (TIGR00375 family)